MKGRTYRFLEKEPLYPFGFGLSYTRFCYELGDIPAELPVGSDLHFTARVTNAGERTDDAVLQVYLTDEEASVRVPLRHLVWFKRLPAMQPGEVRKVEVSIPARLMAVTLEDGTCQVESGEFALSFGGVQPDELSRRLSADPVVIASFTLTGENVKVPY